MSTGDFGLPGDFGVVGEGSETQPLVPDISKVDYMSIIKFCPSFVSLDISQNSTGWSRWHSGVFTTGSFSLEELKEDPVAMRREFRRQMREIFNELEYDFVFVEDVIGSVNFKTAKTLYQLNPIVDDMIDDGILFAKEVIRPGNTEWKKWLRQCSGYKSEIRADSDVKRIVRDCLFLLDFGDGTTDTIVQDIYDSVGMAVGVIYNRSVAKEVKSKKKLKKDVSKGYKIHQFSDEYAALDDANEVGGEIHRVNFMRIKKDLKHNFKKLVTDLDDDSKTFVIEIETSRIGVVALDKGLDLDTPVSYLVIYR